MSRSCVAEFSLEVVSSCPAYLASVDMGSASNGAGIAVGTTDAVISPRVLAIGALNQTKIYDQDDNALLASVALPVGATGPYRIAYDSNRMEFWVQHDDGIQIVNAKAPYAEIVNLALATRPYYVTFNPTNNHMGFFRRNGDWYTLYIYDCATRTEVTNTPISDGSWGHDVAGLAFSQTLNKWMVATWDAIGISGGSSVRRYHATTLAQEDSVALGAAGDRAYSLDWVPETDRVICTHENVTLGIVEFLSFDCSPLALHNSIDVGCTVYPNIIAAPGDGKIYIPAFDATPGAPAWISILDATTETETCHVLTNMVSQMPDAIAVRSGGRTYLVYDGDTIYEVYG